MVVLVRLILPGKGGFEQKRHHMAQLLWVLQAALATSLEKQMVPCRAVKSSPVTVQGIRRGRVINWSSRVVRQAEKRRGPSQALSGHPLGKAHRGIGGPSSNAARQRAHSNTNSLLFLGFFLCSMFLLCLFPNSPSLASFTSQTAWRDKASAINKCIFFVQLFKSDFDLNLIIITIVGAGF